MQYDAGIINQQGSGCSGAMCDRALQTAQCLIAVC